MWFTAALYPPAYPKFFSNRIILTSGNLVLTNSIEPSFELLSIIYVFVFGVFLIFSFKKSFRRFKPL